MRTRASNPFTLGVASGSPKDDSVVLWTRLAPDPLYGGGMGTAGDIEISIEKNTVTIKGEVPSVVKSDHAQGADWYLHELPSGSFHRSLTLPIEVDASKAEATFESGVLRLTLPRAEAARPRQIHVQVGSTQPESPAIADAVDQE